MPYFYKSDEINMLFIHIPKTGGTSIEQYLSYKYKISLNQSSLFSYGYHPPDIVPLQHYTYNNIVTNSNIVLIDGYETFTIVRNPYHRIVSDLFYLGLAHTEFTKEDIYETIKEYYIIDAPHNHSKPQWEFIYDVSNNCLYDHIYVLKIENLNEEIKALGYKDFDIHINRGPIENHMSYLNKESILLINEVYSKDFELFGYEML